MTKLRLAIASLLFAIPAAWPGDIVAPGRSTEYAPRMPRPTLRTTCLRSALVVLSIGLVLLGFACGGGSQGPLRNTAPVEPAPPSGPPKILLVTAGNLFVEGALLVDDSLIVDKVSPPEFDRMVAGGAFPGYRAVILDGHAPTQLPPASVALLYFNPLGEHSPFQIRSRAAHPRVVAIDERHPIMHGLVLSDTNFDDAAIFLLDPGRGDAALVTTDKGPIAAAGRIAGRRVVACGFDLSTTDFPMRVAFPMFLLNALDWLEERAPRDRPRAMR